ncbi:hypothetical protein BDA96_07G139800 [Sorghum bicolor]|uniref:Uncharacterized protein n=1 Tax=Sorghum bicolor TaxID=4558 RepID=A0A921QN75_SORBI|nr:hypothetical protein BDA96_07G139800 [Sorghum bicolor]
MATNPLVPVIPSLVKQLGDHALEKIARDYLEEEDEEEEEPKMVIEEKDEDEKAMNVMDIEEAVITEQCTGKHGTENTDLELEILETTPQVFLSPKKKRAVMIKEKFDDSFLSSKRVSQKMGGFKDAESAGKHLEEKLISKKVHKVNKKIKKTKGAKNKKKTHNASTAMENPIPLAMIPPANSEAAPYLPKNVLEGVGHGFLQIPSETVSAALLDNDDLDD